MATLTVPLVRWLDGKGLNTLTHIVDDSRKGRRSMCGYGIPWRTGDVVAWTVPYHESLSMDLCRRCRRSWGLHPRTSATEGGDTDG